ncbi:hypothetical protein PHYPO_G00160960 [Pangasianodon hypophthalmus]|uniref:Uncharacterized protein n=1 Tax=Pangasianodon hypophthalmus TaxID=310915 RepID=A0A5N5JT88_PANHP|nr:hypothetical protein PHYPO_G00160960 [Pangasianodon hypophthalmus]
MGPRGVFKGAWLMHKESPGAGLLSRCYRNRSTGSSKQWKRHKAAAVAAYRSAVWRKCARSCFSGTVTSLLVQFFSFFCTEIRV